MMHALILSASAVASLIAMPAMAQTPPIGKVMMRSENVHIPPSWRLGPSEVKECLIHKRTKRLQCHTRAEWRAIAAEIDAKQANQNDTSLR